MFLINIHRFLKWTILQLFSEHCSETMAVEINDSVTRSYWAVAVFMDEMKKKKKMKND